MKKITFQVQDSKGVIFYKTTFTMPSTSPITPSVTFGYANAQHLMATEWAYLSDEQGSASGGGLRDPIGLYLPFHSGASTPTLGEPTTQFANYTKDTASVDRRMSLVGYYTKTNFFPKTIVGSLEVKITGNCAKGGSLVLYLGEER